jgi:hypothetical protein
MNAVNNDTVRIATILKPCPYCGSHGIITQAAGQTKFGLGCTGCPLLFPDIYDTPETAVTAWGLRQGTASAAGGRATRGVSTWRKRRSCRRNLRIARREKKLKWIRAQIEAAATRLKELRKIEIQEFEAEAVADFAWLQNAEPLIAGDPVLLRSYRKESVPVQPPQNLGPEDFGRCDSGNSAISTVSGTRTTDPRK